MFLRVKQNTFTRVKVFCFTFAQMRNPLCSDIWHEAHVTTTLDCEGHSTLLLALEICTLLAHDLASWRNEGVQKFNILIIEVLKPLDRDLLLLRNFFHILVVRSEKQEVRSISSSACFIHELPSYFLLLTSYYFLVKKVCHPG